MCEFEIISSSTSHINTLICGKRCTTKNYYKKRISYIQHANIKYVYNNPRSVTLIKEAPLQQSGWWHQRYLEDIGTLNSKVHLIRHMYIRSR